MEVTAWFWIAFNGFVLIMLALDLGVFHRKAHEVALREALMWTGIWLGTAMAFLVGVYFYGGTEPGLEFLTGYLIELSLSVDNIFVFALVFSYFAVPSRYQHRVLFWGIIGALIMRALMIAIGAALIHRFHWVIYVFGAFLVLTGLRMLKHRGVDVDPEGNPVVKLARRLFPLTKQYHGHKFFITREGRRFATPLFLVLLVVEASDVMFAIDSIPAVFGITQDTFIVYTSNVFAILGLRSLYFALAGVLRVFHYLPIGLAVILVLIGIKMLISEIYVVPIGIALGMVVTIIAASIALSLAFPPDEPRPFFARPDDDEEAADRIPLEPGGPTPASRVQAARRTDGGPTRAPRRRNP